MLVHVHVLVLVLGTSTVARADSPEPTEPDIASALAHATGVAGGLTAEQVATAARTSDPTVAARAADVAAATAAVEQAHDAFIPRVALTARFRRLSDISPAPFGNIVVAPDSPVGVLAPGATLASTPLAFPILLDETTFSAQLVIPISDDLLRISRGLAAAHHAEDAAVFAADAERRHAIANARFIYYTWARARLSAIVAADAVRQAELHLADVQQRVAVERASRADMMAVQAQRAAAIQLRVRADDLAAVAETQVRIVLRADAPTGALAIGDELASDLALVDPGADAALLADAIAHRPELRAAGANIDALVEQARAATDSALPRLDLIGDITDANPNPRYIPAEDTLHTTWSLGAQVTWTISDAPGQLAQARGLRAKAAGAAAQRTALVDALHAEVAQAAASVRDAVSAQATTADQLASAEESYRVRRALFREGAATSTELTDAETELTRARLESVAARLDARIAAVRLAHALGRDGGN